MFLLSVLEAPNTKTNSLWVLFLSLILIIIPATINHNNVYTITNDYI